MKFHDTLDLLSPESLRELLHDGDIIVLMIVDMEHLRQQDRRTRSRSIRETIEGIIRKYGMDIV